VIAANRLAYGELLGLLDLYGERVRERGEWLCLTISGQVLRVTAAETLGTGSNSTTLFVNRTDDTRLLLATRVSVDDCAELLARR
jgi:hypothetical protein